MFRNVYPVFNALQQFSPFTRCMLILQDNALDDYWERRIKWRMPHGGYYFLRNQKSRRGSLGNPIQVLQVEQTMLDIDKKIKSLKFVDGVLQIDLFKEHNGNRVKI